jgi:hypothetical protein
MIKTVHKESTFAIPLCIKIELVLYHCNVTSCSNSGIDFLQHPGGTDLIDKPIILHDRFTMLHIELASFEGAATRLLLIHSQTQ